MTARPGEGGPDPLVVVPAELELEERLVGPVTFRMAGWLAVAAAGAALVVSGHGVPDLLSGALLVLTGSAGGLLRPAGRPPGAWVVPALGFLRRTRHSSHD